MTRTLWIDASAGVAGDMLLGALADAGADLDVMQRAVDAVAPEAIRLERSDVLRAGMRAAKVDVRVLVEDTHRRTWGTIRDSLEAAALPEPVRRSACRAFSRLAEAEGEVHGIAPEQVHFHEVGALDALADVVGTCAAITSLGADSVVVSPVALGSGSVDTAHGVLPVPPPAVLTLARGWEVLAGGDGELATPTGVALVTTLAERSGPIPRMTVEALGVGAGTRDTPGRANVARVVVGRRASSHDLPDVHAEGGTVDAVVVEANVDDLDPRLWPEVLDALLASGASDAWLTPILMKKGRPAHTVHVLSSPEHVEALVSALFRETTTLGVRRAGATKVTCPRAWVDVATSAGVVRVKVGHRDGRVTQAMPEFEDVRAHAASSGVPARELLEEARAAARQRELTPGAPWPPTR